MGKKTIPHKKFKKIVYYRKNLSKRGKIQMQNAMLESFELSFLVTRVKHYSLKNFSCFQILVRAIKYNTNDKFLNGIMS